MRALSSRHHMAIVGRSVGWEHSHYIGHICSAEDRSRRPQAGLMLALVLSLSSGDDANTHRTSSSSSSSLQLPTLPSWPKLNSFEPPPSASSKCGRDVIPTIHRHPQYRLLTFHLHSLSLSLLTCFYKDGRVGSIFCLKLDTWNMSRNVSIDCTIFLIDLHH